MAMTPIDISKREFSKGFRGYVTGEVDRFLELVTREFEELYAENFDLNDKLNQLENELSNYKQMEETLKHTLILAQKTAEDLTQTAKHEAGLLLQEAEQTRTQRFREDETKRMAALAEVENTLRKRDLLRIQLKSFLTLQLELLESQSDDCLGALALSQETPLQLINK
ncbi:MAG: DivIVA domain-containing protein [Peptococcaceae bacterium]|jgi:cell division initiation protein|nr:DivIVA domain-containing protein [Peptococcaceae bacterium]